jgi:2-oxoglutarate ferredoxin oxidoreductase subunit beta
MSTPVTSVTNSAVPKYTKKDFQSDQEVRWCPGCGDYAILNAIQQVFPTLGIPREKFVIVSGIGCSSRFPYYMNTFGFHTIHGRAPAVATGLKLANPDLSVWVITGDGDGLSIGGNHLIHALRRNIDLKILLFNNRIYGLTKGQYSPTSELGKVNKSAPFGTVDQPINPISLALASEATFIGRSVAIYAKHLMQIFRDVAAHKGSVFLEIFQNCNVYNDKTFSNVTERDVRDDQNVLLEHGKPLLFGKENKRGLVFQDHKMRAATIGEDGVTEKDVIVHDETDASLAYMLSRLGPPDMPTPMGIFRRVSMPTLGQRVYDQINQARKKLGSGDLKKLIYTSDKWEV